MQNLKKLFCLLISLIILACSSEGEIEIQNKTSCWLDVKIDGDFYELSGNSNVKKSFDLTDYLVSAEEIDVNVSGEGLVKWEFSQDYNIKAGETETVKISADAGAIGLVNNSVYAITAVYLSPSSSGDWGNDDLIGIIYPRENCTWRVTPGYWDIKVVNQNGYAAISRGKYVQIGAVHWLTYSTLNQTLNNIPIKDQQNFNFTGPTEDKTVKYHRNK